MFSTRPAGVILNLTNVSSCPWAEKTFELLCIILNGFSRNTSTVTFASPESELGCAPMFP